MTAWCDSNGSTIYKSTWEPLIAHGIEIEEDGTLKYPELDRGVEKHPLSEFIDAHQHLLSLDAWPKVDVQGCDADSSDSMEVDASATFHDLLVCIRPHTEKLVIILVVGIVNRLVCNYSLFFHNINPKQSYFTDRELTPEQNWNET